MSNSLDPNQIDVLLGLICIQTVQRLSADNTSRQKVTHHNGQAVIKNYMSGKAQTLNAF